MIQLISKGVTSTEGKQRIMFQGVKNGQAELVGYISLDLFGDQRGVFTTGKLYNVTIEEAPASPAVTPPPSTPAPVAEAVGSTPTKGTT